MAFHHLFYYCNIIYNWNTDGRNIFLGKLSKACLKWCIIMDMLKDIPTNDPIGYAHDYYSQFPSLTILFYPPLYSFILALFGIVTLVLLIEDAHAPSFS